MKGQRKGRKTRQKGTIQVFVFVLCFFFSPKVVLAKFEVLARRLSVPLPHHPSLYPGPFHIEFSQTGFYTLCIFLIQPGPGTMKLGLAPKPTKLYKLANPWGSWKCTYRTWLAMLTLLLTAPTCCSPVSGGNHPYSPAWQPLLF